MSISCAVVTANYEANYYVIMAAFVFVIILAFLTTRWLAKSRFSNSKGNNIKVVERVFISTDKVLLIVQVHDAYYLMSQDKNGLKMMDKLENFIPEEQVQDTRFSDILEKLKSKNKEK